MLTKAFFLKNFDRSKELIPLSYADVFGAASQLLKKHHKQVDTEIDVQEDLIEDPVFEIDILELLNEAPELLFDSKNPRVKEAQIIIEKAKKDIASYFHLDNILDTDNLGLKATVTEKIQFTEKQIEAAVQNKKAAIIFKPVFTVNQCLIQPDAVVVHANGLCEFVVIKATTNTKRKFILEIIYDFLLFEKLGKYKLVNYYFCIVNYELKNKHNVSFFLNTEIKTAKNSSTSKTKEEQVLYGHLPFNDPKKIAYIHSKKSGGVNGFLLVKLVDNIIRSGVTNLEQIISFVFRELNAPSIRSLKQIISEVAKVQLDFWNIIDDVKQHQELQDNQITFNYSDAFNSFWNNYLLRNLIKLVFAYKYSEIFRLSGKLAKWDEVVEAYKENKSVKIDGFLYELNQGKMKKTKNPATSQFNKIHFFLRAWNDKKGIAVGNKFKSVWQKLKEKKVYFDFETISSAVRVIDKSLPFTQIVTQCSLIVDDNTESDKSKLVCQNLIFDPLTIGIEDFKTVVDALYQKQCDQYSFVVYNKSFEKNRLLEMATFINEAPYQQRVQAIIENLFDLADIFGLENDCLAFKQLNGFSSIKKVLPMIDQRFLDASRTVSYQSLKVQKGDVAQELTLARFLNCLDEQQWAQTALELKQYCENDVRAMIAIELFIKDFITNQL